MIVVRCPYCGVRLREASAFGTMRAVRTHIIRRHGQQGA